ncbi:MAG: methylmalonyl Co-A mutase-associated GTPase MeaB, partial [Vicinamibacterales bacterium]
DVQALKAGVMEIADIFVVNKADRDGADRLVAAIDATLALKDAEPGVWRPPVVQAVATTGSGTGAVVDRVAAFLRHQAADVSSGPARTGRIERQRARAEHRLRDLVARGFSRHVEQSVLEADELQHTLDQIASRALDPYSAADALLGRALRTPLGRRQDGAS